MTDNNLDRLLNYMWRAEVFSGREFDALGGERVLVVSPGEPAEGSLSGSPGRSAVGSSLGGTAGPDGMANGGPEGVWLAAEVVVDGERRRGPVAVGDDARVPDGAVLRVTVGRVRPVLGVDDRFVTQIEARVAPHVRERYRAMMEGRGRCPARIGAMDEVHRTALYTRLAVERLHRKTRRIEQLWETAERDWNETFHTLLFQSMGGDRNKEAFTTLARRATAATASREKGSPRRVEALLLGTAGFLFAPAERDDYTLELEEEARHLLAKHSIVPMRTAVWDVAGVRPVNHPAVRLAELAALIAGRDFLLDGALGCRRVEDVERLFGVGASDYWRSHYAPSDTPHPPHAKTIGRTKAHLVGINLVAPLMFAYGRETGREELCERALDLLASIPAERNRKLERWWDGGCPPRNAVESQSLLELEGEYCTRGGCAECRVGRAEIKKALAEAEVPQ